MASGFKLPKPGSRVAPSDDINDYSIAIFGPKSAGKTILASCFPKTLNFRFERWRANVRINQYPARKEDPALTWEGFKELAAQAMDAPEDERPYKRFVIDSIDEAWLMCQKETCREKFGIDSPEELGGDSYLAHQACTWEWGDTWDTIRDNGIALTWLSHCKERQMPDPMRKLGTFKMLSMSCAPSAADIVRQRCDLVWFLMKYGDGSNCKRILTVRTEEASEIVTQLRDHFKSPKGDYLYQLAVPHVPADDSPELFKFIKNGWDNKLTNYDPYGDIDEPDTEDGEVNDAPKGALSLRKSAKKKTTKKTTTKKRPSLR